MKTHLTDSGNFIQLSKNSTLEDFKFAIDYRIDKHREYNRKNMQTIKDNVDFDNIVMDMIQNITERNIKIEELKEFKKSL